MATEPAPGPRIVRAWFDTIINPLLHALEIESIFIANLDWTWRFKRDGFEHIGPIRAYLGPEGVVNLEQLLENETNLSGPMEEHDKAVEALRDACAALQKALAKAIHVLARPDVLTSDESLADLQPILREWLHSSEMTRDLVALARSDKNLDAVQLTAQYIVNSTRALGPEYTTMQYWNKHRDRFLSLLEHPSPTIHAPWTQTMEAGERLARAGARLTGALKDARKRLSLFHDVPLVETPRDGEDALLE